MCTYGTDSEKAETSLIRKYFPEYLIVNPGYFQPNMAISDGSMKHFFRIIDGCHVLVFSRLLDDVTAGVGLEVNHAISRPIPVYELRKGWVEHVAPICEVPVKRRYGEAL